MKSFLSAVAIALVFISTSAVSVDASIQVEVNDLITLNRPAGTFGTLGGIFQVDILTKGVAPPLYDFSTFCVQTSEFITLGTTYRVDGITKNTVAGDVKLGSFAAWLYTKFLGGSISIVDNADANAVQVGIWQSMGYAIPAIIYDTTLLSSLTTLYNGDATWAAQAPDVNGNKTGHISIANLMSLSGGHAQDQLVHHMPEPMSAVVWSLMAMCVGGVGLGRRRAG